MSTFAYNAADLPVTTTLHTGTANQAQEQRVYDADNRLTCVSAAGPLGAQVPLVESVGYAHSPLGVTTAISSYGANSCQIAAPALVQTLGYDPQGRLTTTGGRQWAYDGNGNLTSVAVSQTAALSYTYANADGSEPAAWLPNELVATRYYSSTGPLASSYSYDGSGAATAIVVTPTGSQPTVRETLGYNAQGLLAGVTTSDGLQVTLGYNARGLRASVAVTDTAPREWSPLGPVSQAATRFTETMQYQGGQVSRVVVADAADPFSETFLYRPDGSPLELLYQRAGGPVARYWYVLDGQGSVVALVDATGSVVNRYRYDLWGGHNNGTNGAGRREGGRSERPGAPKISLAAGVGHGAKARPRRRRTRPLRRQAQRASARVLSEGDRAGGAAARPGAPAHRRARRLAQLRRRRHLR